MLILQDSYIRLTPLSIGHFDALMEIAKARPDTWQYTPNTAYGRENMQRYIETALLKRTAGTHIPFAIALQENGRILGSTRFCDIDHHHQSASIGCSWLHCQMRGKSINKRSKFLMLQHAFEVWDMQRIHFTADVNNTASISALLNIGCTQEGVLRSHLVLSDGRRRDTAVFSILQHEWHGRIKSMLAAKIKAQANVSDGI